MKAQNSISAWSMQLLVPRHLPPSLSHADASLLASSCSRNLLHPRDGCADINLVKRQHSVLNLSELCSSISTKGFPSHCYHWSSWRYLKIFVTVF